MRATIRRLASVVAAGVAGVFVVWALARGLSDRFVWSQLVSWVQPQLVLVLAGGGMALAEVLRAVGRERPRRRRARRLAPTRVVGWGSVVVLGVWAATSLTGIPRVRSVPNEGNGVFTILHWNPSEGEPERILEAVNEADPDVAVLVNVPYWAEFGPGGLEHNAIGRFDVLTRFAVLERSHLLLGVTRNEVPKRSRPLDWLSAQTRRFDVHPDPWDTGAAACVVLDVGELTPTGELVIWMLDLPSDLAIPRSWMARRAREVLDAYEGPILVAQEDGVLVAQQRGLPEPDIVLGDFNIPRGAWSLGLLVPGMRSAAGQARAGWRGTFPREFPLVQIDHMFLSRTWSCADYTVTDPGTGAHRMQVARIRARTDQNWK